MLRKRNAAPAARVGSGTLPASVSGPSRGPIRDEPGANARADAPAPLDVLSTIPMHASGPGGDGRDAVDPHGTARRGLSGPATTLPHLATIQALFGRHDVRATRAHVGGPAGEAARALGARAYATRGAVAFDTIPDLRTAAHEAAHLVQQRQGVRLPAGLGRPGDAYELAAEAVAERVARGASVEGLLGPPSRACPVGSASALQLQELPSPDATQPGAAAAKAAPADDTLLQGFDEVGGGRVRWNLDLLTTKAARGLRGSKSAYVEVVVNWQPDPSRGTSSTVRDHAVGLATNVRRALQQWGNFPDRRIRARTRSVSVAGDAPRGSFKDVEVWLRSGTGVRPAPSSLPAAPGVALTPEGRPAAPLGTLPPASVKRIRDLADLVAAAEDPLTRDPLVKELREWIVKIQPLLPDDEMRETLDEAVVKGAGEGIKAAVMAALEAITGKSPSEIGGDPSRLGPNIPQRDLEEKIVTLPEITVDPIPEVKRYSFEFRGLKSSYSPGGWIGLTLLTPDYFTPSGPGGAGRVVVMEASDWRANGARADTVQSRHIEGKGKVAITLQAPERAGEYVLGVRVGGAFEDHPIFHFKVGK